MKLRLSRSFVAPWLAFAWAILPWLQPGSLAEPAEPARESPPAAAADKLEGDKSVEKTPEESQGPSATIVDAAESAPAAPTPPRAKAERKEKRWNKGNSHPYRSSGTARVSVLHDSTLESGGETDAVVSILGSSTSEGTVRDAVVSVFGSSTSSGQVGNAVVSVFGNTRVTGGSVGDSAVAVIGNTYVNGHVRGEVVAVFGNVELGPEAVVDGKIVCVGGAVERDPKAIVHGEVLNVAIGAHQFVFEGLTAWISQCLAYGRLLAFGPRLLWAWWIALTFLTLYAFIALVAPGPVANCVQTLEERPGKAILAAVLAMLLTPVVYVLLALTVFIVVGVALIPLFTLGMFFAGVFGKVVMFAWLGWRMGKLWNGGRKMPAVAAVLMGGVIILGLYTVPVLGFLVYKLLGILGVGVVVYTLLLSIKSNRPVVVPPLAQSIAQPAAGPLPGAVEGTGATPPVLPAAAVLPAAISAATLPRAGFWLRFGAALLDVIMVSVLLAMLDGVFSWFLRISGSFPLWFAIYNVVMWATKGTTIGGIICGLKVVRLDDRPIDWGVAIVRGLGAFLSLVVAGLGFIWVGFDDERQSWHDKIAGTTIVRVPKGTSLI